MTATILPVLCNIRSSYNVGAILRTCAGFGVEEVVACGYTPYPRQPADKRLPHIAARADAAIAKTALGTERMVRVTAVDDIAAALQLLRQREAAIWALEQADHAQPLPSAKPIGLTALLLGEEVHGVPPEVLTRCQAVYEIPMRGAKESFNVSVATGIALYQLCMV